MMNNIRNNKIYNRHAELVSASVSHLKKRSRNKFGMTMVILLLLTSCANIFEKNISAPAQSKSSDGKAYLIVGNASIKKTSSSARAATGNLGPDTEEANTANLTKLVLSGKKAAGAQMKPLTDELENLAALQAQRILIEEGSWEFKLSAELNGIPFSSDVVSKTIVDGVENKISFVLKADVTYGKLEITVEWTNDASKVLATLQDVARQNTIASKSFTTFEEIQIQGADGTSVTGHKVNITIDKDNDGKNLASGNYYLSIDFGTDDVQSLSKSEFYVNIANGFTTRASVHTDLSPTYPIVYDEGSVGGTFIGTTKPLNYNRKSLINLPEMRSESKLFTGWYDDDGNKITGAVAGSTKSGTLTFHAQWGDPVLYVSGTGDDSADGLSEGTPLETVNKACEIIVESGGSDMAWTIYIMGDVTGPHSSANKAGARGSDPRSAGDTDFGRSEIPADITTDYAKSIELIGKTGLDENGYPQDMINRGLVQGTLENHSNTGNVLAIATTVPVTIKNLKITGGVTYSTNSNSTNDPYYDKGGGLHIAEGANVILGNGVLITRNKGYNGGAVYNAGTLTMIGTATIGDKNATTYPQATLSGQLQAGNTRGSNEYKYGGGIYNIGTVYLGIKDEIDENNSVLLTGGIYNSYGDSACGGGLYNTGSGTIIMSSGNIKFNDGQSLGGGVCINSGTFTMNGGEMFYNSTGGKGGAVYVSGGAVFKFGGGKISGHNANVSGGAVYIEGSTSNVGKMFMYGNAVIGNSSQTTMPSVIGTTGTQDEIKAAVKAAMTDGSNVAPLGAGIYVQGELYMGYTSETVTASLSGGIFYNTAKGTSNGGAIYVKDSYAKVYMNGGTIAYNYALQGSAAYYSSGSITIGGTASIPAGDGTIKQDVYYSSSSSAMLINDSLINAGGNVFDNIDDESIYIIYYASTYSTSKKFIDLTSEAKTNNISINDVKGKFKLKPTVNTDTGITANWIINSNGNPAANQKTLYVSDSGQNSNDGLTSTSALDSINTAVSKINGLNDTYMDYIIMVSGEILGTQTIADTSSTEKVKANSITIKGNSGKNGDVPKACLNANLGATDAGTALTINTAVPVTLNLITVKGGHGTISGSDDNAKIIGGGLLLGESTKTVILDNYTQIRENTTYISGKTSPGYGAGVYISNGAKLYLYTNESHCCITENVGTTAGAGVYIADGGCLQSMAGCASNILLNTFRKNYVSGGSPQGGGVYIDNGATYEMFGAWVRDNCLTGASCLGSGIYINTSGNIKIKGHTEVIAPNDIYLKANVQVGIEAALDPYNPSDYKGPILTGRLTPENYTNTDVLVKLTDDSAVGSFSSYTRYFDVSPQDDSGVTKFWSLDTTGKLVAETGIGISVTIPTGLSNDIQVTVTSNGTTVDNNTHLSGGATLVFTANSNTGWTYTWKLDGIVQTVTTPNILELNTASWSKGVYDVYLEASDSNHQHYSYTAQIKVN